MESKGVRGALWLGMRDFYSNKDKLLDKNKKLLKSSDILKKLGEANHESLYDLWKQA